MTCFSWPAYFVLLVCLTVACIFVMWFGLPEYFVVPVYLTVVCHVFQFTWVFWGTSLPASCLWCVSVCPSIFRYQFTWQLFVMCFSLPEYFVVPFTLTNADLQKVAGQYIEKRLPVSSRLISKKVSLAVGQIWNYPLTSTNPPPPTHFNPPPMMRFLFCSLPPWWHQPPNRDQIPLLLVAYMVCYLCPTKNVSH